MYMYEKLQQVLQLHGYDALNLLSCMTLDVDNIHSVVDQNFTKCWIMQETLEMQPKKVSRERPIGGRSILQIQSLGILCPNVHMMPSHNTCQLYQ